MNELTDLETLAICKKIAEIEGFTFTVDINDNVILDDASGDTEQNWIKVYHEYYDPLTNDALCFQLMIKHEVKVSTYYKIDDKTPYYCAETLDLNEVEARTPQNAVCLAIIEANKE